MKRVVFVVLTVLSVAFCKAAVAVDATSAWNTYCATYHFASYPQSSSTTFMQAYSGTNLPNDFAAIKAAVGGSVQSSGMGIEFNDLMNANLENWY